MIAPRWRRRALIVLVILAAQLLQAAVTLGLCHWGWLAVCRQ